MTRLSFSIPGEPTGKARPRAVASIVWRDGEPEAVVRLVTPKETRAAERRIADLFRRRFRDHVPWTGAVMLRFTAVFETPQSFNKAQRAAALEAKLYANKKPDKDNIEKLIADSLNGLAWHDDAQLHGGGIKRYGSPARIDVVLELIEQPDVPATPGQRQLERRVAAGETGSPKRRPRGNLPKSGSKTPLQRAIDAAVARDAQRGLF